MADSRLIHRVVGSFPTRGAAEEAVEAAVHAGGDRASVAFDNADDERHSLLAEQQQEMDSSSAGPLTGAIPGPARKALYVVLPLATAVGIVIGLLLALIPIGHWTLAGRLLVYGLVGAACGSTIGFIVGGGFGALGPGRPTAGDRGVLVGVSAPADVAPAVASAMAKHDPIRVDLLSSAGVGHVVADADDRSALASTERVVRRASRTADY
ncbi:MAG TPA: hypothetical protein VHT30_01810 [Acidimicrobiales bacterium]|jgi:hypothetical protein|nr:hypothetical protein [Acidimicrobiales bacterium]